MLEIMFTVVVAAFVLIAIIGHVMLAKAVLTSDPTA
jgi:hypothetical protein